MAKGLTRVRYVRMQPRHDEAIQEIARRRGCDVSDLFREAVIAHFSLPTDETIEKKVNENEGDDYR